MFFRYNFPEKLTRKTLNEISDFLRFKKIISEECKISVGFKNVSSRKIKNFNNNYRNKNEPTDILSFGYEFNKNILEGDLVLCWDIIKKNAKDDKIKPEQELRKNLIHGCLHLVEMEHSKEMFKLQAEFLKL
jgi:probable rRNA maturation factor